MNILNSVIYQKGQYILPKRDISETQVLDSDWPLMLLFGNNLVRILLVKSWNNRKYCSSFSSQEDFLLKYLVEFSGKAIGFWIFFLGGNSFVHGVIINSYRPHTILYLFVTSKFCFCEGLLLLLVYNPLEGQNFVFCSFATPVPNLQPGA